jgi:hypothetical protein
MAETKGRLRTLRIPRLDTLHSIKDEAIRLYRRAAKGSVSSAGASRQANVLRVAKECMVEAKLEQEVTELRATLLALQGCTGSLHMFDAGGFQVTRKREPWGIRYVYTPRPPMLRTIINIEKAAQLTTVETANGPRFRRFRHVDSAPTAPEAASLISSSPKAA